MYGALVCEITLFVCAIHKKFGSYDLDLTALLRFFVLTGPCSFHDKVHKDVMYRVNGLDSLEPVHFYDFSCLEFEVMHRCVLKVFLAIEIDWFFNVFKQLLDVNMLLILVTLFFRVSLEIFSFDLFIFIDLTDRI